MLVSLGFALANPAGTNPPALLDRPISLDLFTAIGASLVPVMFAYGGWQTSCFVAGELRAPQRDLPRGLLIGVVGVIVLYLAVNLVCVYVLGVDGLMATSTPASQVMRIALGETGAKIIAIGITISTLGFLSQSILTAPRVYFAMAHDRVFFKQVAWVHPKTLVPVIAIILQGMWAILIAISGRYEQILNYVVSVDFIFFGLSATCVFIFRRRDRSKTKFRIPLHPFTTIFFIAGCFFVVANTIYKYPENSVIGLTIMLLGIPIFFLWKRKEPSARPT
jgi:APA family basic amino acid/polyamine antiporter